MARFRNYKVYPSNNTNDSVDNWESRYNGLRVNRITNKTIIRTFINYFKYGNKSKKVFI